MQPSSSLTEAQRGAAVALFEQGRGDSATARYLGVSRWPVRVLHRRWVLHGRKALVAKPTRTAYSFEFKLDVVCKVIDEGAAAQQVAQEYGLSSATLVQTWVRAYRRLGEDGLKPKPKGRQPKDADSSSQELTDLQRLEQENVRLRAENAYLKKLRALRAHERR
ncbi:transposase [Mycolicibacterium wolinskyi]|uniref:Transposase n=1 Tax=Mycolicibacterium wolinskyi TaxID=59750 RepID=A0A132PAR5_9MYCO|nr:transposase [Mycolicibacterium wolinskyi]